MNCRTRGLVIVTCLFAAQGCDIKSLTGIDSKTATSGIKTYQAFWINSNWAGAGEAPTGKAVGPTNFTGSYCPMNSLIMENHTNVYKSVWSWSATVLVFKNTCNASANLLVCITAGGIRTDLSEFPVCNIDPRTTPLSRLHAVDMGPNNSSGNQSTTWRQTGVTLSLNVFYCGVGDTFTLGAISGVAPTDCLKQ